MTFPANFARCVHLSAIALLISLTSFCNQKQESPWRTVPIEKGDLNVEVTASGTVNPHFLVAVGTQVSGTISQIFVDFNSPVKKGQLIMLLDTTFLHAAITDAGATLQKTLAQEKLTSRNAERAQSLFEKGLASQADLDQAIADQASSVAAVSSARAQLDRAKINIRYASIRSPITGVVVNRNVDVGQTVASSFSTPTLFSIADDLSKMQIQASIDEADIGQIMTGQAATFTVDAYPDSTFTGVVSQKRLQPLSVQNVVSYTVMIDVENPGLLLMPGMTANVTIAVKQERNVLKVPVAALKFAPPRTGKNGHPIAKAAGIQQGKRQHPDSTGVQGPAFGHKSSPKIFLLKEGKPVRVPVTTGLSTGGYTAIEGNVQAGQEVIIGSAIQTKTQAPQGSPLGMPRRMP